MKKFNFLILIMFISLTLYSPSFANSPSLVFFQDISFNTYFSGRREYSPKENNKKGTLETYRYLLDINAIKLWGMNFYGTLGITNARLKGGGFEEAEDTDYVEFKNSPTFGCKLQYGFFSPQFLLANTQFLFVKLNEPNYLSDLREKTGWGYNAVKGATFFEVSGALKLMKEFGNFSPYAGLRYLVTIFDLDVDAWTIQEARESRPEFWIENLEFKNKVGLILGTDFKYNDNIFLNVEGHFLDENALNLAIKIKL